MEPDGPPELHHRRSIARHAAILGPVSPRLIQSQARSGIKDVNIRRGDFDSDYFANCWSYLGGHGNVDLVAIILEADKACLAVELIALNGSTKRFGIVVQAE